MHNKNNKPHKGKGPITGEKKDFKQTWKKSMSIVFFPDTATS